MFRKLEVNCKGLGSSKNLHSLCPCRAERNKTCKSETSITPLLRVAVGSCAGLPGWLEELEGKVAVVLLMSKRPLIR